MDMLGEWTRWGMVLMTVVLGAVVARFAWSQRQGALGGKMSLPKALWLLWAVLIWFFVCPMLAFDVTIPTPWRWVMGVFAINMWCRGLIELYMLYGPKSWKPPYGISHNVFSMALLMTLVFVFAPPYTTGWGLVMATWFGVLMLSLAVETYYAVAFHHVVKGQTTGDDGVWFADAEDPKFRRINQVTTFWNVVLYGVFGGLQVCAWGLL